MTHDEFIATLASITTDLVQALAMATSCITHKDGDAMDEIEKHANAMVVRTVAATENMEGSRDEGFKAAIRELLSYTQEQFK